MKWNAIRFFREYNIPTRTDGPNCSIGFINICCPSCRQGDDNFHLGYNIKSNYFNCWREGKLPILLIIRLLLHIDNKQAKEILDQYKGSSSILQALNKKKPKATSLALPGKPLQFPHRKYLESRNFDPDYLISKYKLLGTRPGELFKGIDYEIRIVIPIIYKEGKVVSFQARDITGKAKLKYKACPIEYSIIDPKQILYNLNNCNKDRILVVEGVFDVFRIGDNCAATFGTSLTEGQIKELLVYKDIFWLFDPEYEAQERARKAAEKIGSLGKYVELINLEDISRDPAELTEKEVMELRGELNI